MVRAIELLVGDEFGDSGVVWQVCDKVAEGHIVTIFAKDEEGLLLVIDGNELVIALH